MMKGGMGNLMKQAQQMQEKMAKMQAENDKRRLEVFLKWKRKKAKKKRKHQVPLFIILFFFFAFLWNAGKGQQEERV